MTDKPRFFYVVSMDVEPEYEDLFNEVYDTEHVPHLSAVPGVTSATRSVREPLLRLNLMGKEQVIDPGGEPKYSVTYEISSPDVPHPMYCGARNGQKPVSGGAGRARCGRIPLTAAISCAKK